MPPLIPIWVAAAVAFSAGGAEPAERAAPGTNGAIVFVRNDPRKSDSTIGLYHTDLWMVTRGGRARPLLQRPELEATPHEPDWSPDGRQLVFAMSCSNKYSLGCAFLARANANGTGLHSLAPAGAGPLNPSDSSPAWSPDGRRIAFVSRAPGTNGIAVMDENGGGRLSITTGPDSAPTWSPNGEKIAFVRSGDVFVTGVSSGAAPRRLRATPRIEGSPSWSPDGTKIAFDRRERSGYRSVYVMRRDGTGLLRLAAGRTPGWSPDGRWITYARGFDIWVMRQDGREQRRLTSGRRVDETPVWQPLPR